MVACHAVAQASEARHEAAAAAACAEDHSEVDVDRSEAETGLCEEEEARPGESKHNKAPGSMNSFSYKWTL